MSEKENAGKGMFFTGGRGTRGSRKGCDYMWKGLLSLDNMYIDFKSTSKTK